MKPTQANFECLKCSMSSIKCTCSDSGAFAGAGAVRYVHCAVCRVQCEFKDEDLAMQKEWVKLKKKKKNGKNSFTKTMALVYFLKTVWDCKFLKLKRRNKVLIEFSKSFCVTSLFGKVNFSGDWYQVYVKAYT